MAGCDRNKNVAHQRPLLMGNDRRESSNSKLRDEFLNGEIVNSLLEAQVPAERWRVYCNTRWPHSSLGYRPTRW